MNTTHNNFYHFQNQQKKLKVAFLGGAYDSAVGRAHRAAIEMDQHFDLIAGCFSRNPEKNRISAAEYRIEPDRTYLNLDHLLKNESLNLDAIIILTPPNQHGSQVIDCLKAKIPVICEKALATSSSEARLIRECQINNKGFVTVTYNYTGYPILRELKHMIESGKLGKIQQLQMEMPQEGFARLTSDGSPLPPQEWRLHDCKIPTLSFDLGIHLLMMARFLFDGIPEEVVALSSSRGNFSEIVDNVQCLIRYSGDIDCGIWYSKTAFGYRNGLRLRIFGDKGSAEWVQENPEFLQYADNFGNKYTLDRASKDIQIANKIRYQRFKAGHPAGYIEAFANYYVDIAKELWQYRTSRTEKSFGKYVFGVQESIDDLVTLEAIARSSLSHQWEPVPTAEID